MDFLAGMLLAGMLLLAGTWREQTRALAFLCSEITSKRWIRQTAQTTVLTLQPLKKQVSHFVEQKGNLRTNSLHAEIMHKL